MQFALTKPSKSYCLCRRILVGITFSSCRFSSSRSEVRRQFLLKRRCAPCQHYLNLSMRMSYQAPRYLYSFQGLPLLFLMNRPWSVAFAVCCGFIYVDCFAILLRISSSTFRPSKFKKIELYLYYQKF